jgi:hypothetical protein
MLYAYYRYREEKHKEEKLLIPKLESYKEKFLEERENFTKRSQELKDKMEEVKREIENLKTISRIPMDRISNQISKNHERLRI